MLQLPLDMGRLIKAMRHETHGLVTLHRTTGEIAPWSRARGGGEYALIPAITAADSHKICCDWLAEMRGCQSADLPIIDQLDQALHSGPGAFGRFKAALAQMPTWNVDYLGYRAKTVREFARKWLAGLGIEATTLES